MNHRTPDQRLDQLRTAAARFRMAIERCNRNELGIGFEKFPEGSCGDATQLLGAYLADEGFGTFTYVSGWRGHPNSGGYSHAWLEADGIIVDITAEQFAGIDQKVIVTRHSDWHAAFQRNEQVGTADYRISAPSLKPDYRAILAELEQI